MVIVMVLVRILVMVRIRCCIFTGIFLKSSINVCAPRELGPPHPASTCITLELQLLNYLELQILNHTWITLDCWGPPQRYNGYSSVLYRRNDPSLTVITIIWLFCVVEMVASAWAIQLSTVLCGHNSPVFNGYLTVIWPPMVDWSERQ